MTASVEDLLRGLAPQVLAALTRQTGDFAAAEDAVQEALVEAARHWPADVPDDPAAWLVRVAGRKLLDAVRSDAARRRREQAVASREVPAEPTQQTDDTLLLLLLCCHPSLTATSAVALTLRAVGGLRTGEIAAAFLVPEATMAQRISRAKRTVAASGARFAPPADGERTRRLALVLRVLYLIFNEGYGGAGRVDLVAEAIRLTRGLSALLPDDPEVAGLLALMLLHDARRAARTDARGRLVPLLEQDRGRWDRAEIAEGVAVLQGALRQERRGEYQIQAAIAALHDDAAGAEETDWAQILAWYDELLTVTDTPLVRLNRAVALAEVDGPLVAMDSIEQLDPSVPRLAAVRGHLAELAGDHAAAARFYVEAARRSASSAERDHLLRRAAVAAESSGERLQRGDQTVVQRGVLHLVGEDARQDLQPP